MTTTTPAPSTAACPTDKRGARGRGVGRLLAAGGLTLGLAAAGGYAWLDATADVQATGTADCTAVTPSGPAAAHLDVCNVLDQLVGAWDRGDADAYGAMFTDDATYTTYVGTHYQGRRDITESHRALFGGFVKGTKLADSYLDIRFYGPGTAIVTSRGDTYEGQRPQPAELSKTQTYTLVRQDDGTWRIAAFHNTKRQSVMERISFLISPQTRPEAEK
ncbi:SgcJ/EcaC family oxidoreductase [Micromonospora sp. DR5-3]|uniref:SgcJ/EcaC family oxidoreductase n=1 Tax=unclassified Micromonospora TaxID=2617518 RepID=UPI0011D85D5F|nr:MULTISPECIES: SgcJ/EcaC family oxidoreductase [unclassified Micromonospora]MCW3818767.1 SgcJ/EcaC family oxidoreductase [Micromonospora sp. DR5-3]TYC21557.1 SgcJ/EcaC family oxidoreductase [Micromonospora sp. MP36]